MDEARAGLGGDVGAGQHLQLASVERVHVDRVGERGARKAGAHLDLLLEQLLHGLQPVAGDDVVLVVLVCRLDDTVLDVRVDADRLTGATGEGPSKSNPMPVSRALSCVSCVSCVSCSHHVGGDGPGCGGPDEGM